MPNTIEAVAKSFMHSVECIEQERQRDLIAEYLDPSNKNAIDYDDAYFHFACKDLKLADEPFDLFVTLAYEFSSRDLTPEQAKRAHDGLCSLASSVLSFNATEGSVWSEQAINAIL